VLRALTSRGKIFEPAYRVRLPLPSTQPLDVLRAPKNALTVEQAGNARLGADGEWQRLDILAQLDRITIALNDSLVAVYRVNSFAGYMLFTSRKGHVRLRNVKVAEITPKFEPSEHSHREGDYGVAWNPTEAVKGNTPCLLDRSTQRPQGRRSRVDGTYRSAQWGGW
jgi:hypothetical protein